MLSQIVRIECPLYDGPRYDVLTTLYTPILTFKVLAVYINMLPKTTCKYVLSNDFKTRYYITIKLILTKLYIKCLICQYRHNNVFLNVCTKCVNVKNGM